MRYFSGYISGLFLSLLILSVCKDNIGKSKLQPIAIAVHGGAGTILKENMTPELEAEYKNKLEEALRTGYKILKNNGCSLDAVEAAIVVLEDQ